MCHVAYQSLPICISYVNQRHRFQRQRAPAAARLTTLIKYYMPQCNTTNIVQYYTTHTSLYMYDKTKTISIQHTE